MMPWSFLPKSIQTCWRSRNLPAIAPWPSWRAFSHPSSTPPEPATPSTEASCTPSSEAPAGTTACAPATSAAALPSERPEAPPACPPRRSSTDASRECAPRPQAENLSHHPAAVLDPAPPGHCTRPLTPAAKSTRIKEYVPTYSYHGTICNISVDKSFFLPQPCLFTALRYR